MTTTVTNSSTVKHDLEICVINTDDNKEGTGVILSLYITPYKQFYVINDAPSVNSETKEQEHLKTKIHLNSEEAFEWIEKNCPELKNLVTSIINDKPFGTVKMYTSTAEKVWHFIKDNPNLTKDEIVDKFKGEVKCPSYIINSFLRTGAIKLVSEKYITVGDIYAKGKTTVPKKKYNKPPKVKSQLIQDQLTGKTMENTGITTIGEIKKKIDELKEIEKKLLDQAKASGNVDMVAVLGGSGPIGLQGLQGDSSTVVKDPTPDKSDPVSLPPHSDNSVKITDAIKANAVKPTEYIVTFNGDNVEVIEAMRQQLYQQHGIKFTVEQTIDHIFMNARNSINPVFFQSTNSGFSLAPRYLTAMHKQIEQTAARWSPHSW